MVPIDSAALEGGNLAVTVASGDALDIRQFSVHERMSSLFTVNLNVLSDNPAIDFDAVVGQPARFSLRGELHERAWSGICSHLEQVATEQQGLSTYQLTIVPDLWLATQRRNYRMFQHISEPDIVLELLAEWAIKPEVKLTATYKKRKYRVQYGESDYTFMCRMLEDAGIAFYFVQGQGGATKLVLSDAPHLNELREPALPFKDDTSMPRGEHVTGVRIGQQVRPGRYTMRDHDYRRPPANQPITSAEAANVDVERRLERYHYTPGAFLFGTDKGEATPNADDRGKTRVDEAEAALLAQKRLEAKRGSAKVCTFDTNALDLAPGVVMHMEDHPRPDLGPDRKLLVVEAVHAGLSTGAWSQRCEVRSADRPYRPPIVTPKPRAMGAESATVVGPPGEEIHTDEFGRVRVHFHWDRESQMDDKSSCWIHVSQPWGGAGFGGMNLPRVGQEVLVEFLGGDPDRPIIVGRVYTNLQKVPYKLPEGKTQSGWKSNSYPGGGGSNEIRFEDAKGKEQVYIQAEKDLRRLTKHNEDITIGNNLTKLVGANEREITGANRSMVVGINRSAQVGHIDSTMVGDTHVVQVSPPEEGGPSNSTSVTMKKHKIVLDTGAGATITMNGAKITMEADYIRLTARKQLFARGKKGASLRSGERQLALNGKSVSISATGGDVSIAGAPMVKINAPGMPSARLGDMASGIIVQGSPTVLVGLSPPGFPVSPTLTPRPGEDPRVTAMRTLLQGSETGRRALEMFDRNGVGVNFASGTGSFYDPSTNTMTLDVNESLSERSLTFVHEMNHADYQNTGRAANTATMSRDDYVNSRIREESEGTVMSIEAQRELESSGYDVGNTSFPLQNEYEQAYTQAANSYSASHPGATAAEIDAAGRQAGYNAVENGFNNGSVVTSNTNDPYRDYYGSEWDNAHPTP